MPIDEQKQTTTISTSSLASLFAELNQLRGQDLSSCHQQHAVTGNTELCDQQT